MSKDKERAALKKELKKELEEELKADLKEELKKELLAEIKAEEEAEAKKHYGKEVLFLAKGFPEVVRIPMGLKDQKGNKVTPSRYVFTVCPYGGLYKTSDPVAVKWIEQCSLFERGSIMKFDNWDDLLASPMAARSEGQMGGPKMSHGPTSTRSLPPAAPAQKGSPEPQAASVKV